MNVAALCEKAPLYVNRCIGSTIFNWGFWTYDINKFWQWVLVAESSDPVESAVSSDSAPVSASETEHRKWEIPSKIIF